MPPPCYASPMTTTILALLFACAPETDAEPATVVAPPPTVCDCPAGAVVAPIAPRANWSIVAATVGEPGQEVAPWVQVWADRVAVRCPDSGGTLTIEWGAE